MYVCACVCFFFLFFQAWLGFYKSHLKRIRWSKESLVAAANSWVINVCKQEEVPGLQPKTLAKMGLRGVSIVSGILACYICRDHSLPSRMLLLPSQGAGFGRFSSASVPGRG